MANDTQIVVAQWDQTDKQRPRPEIYGTTPPEFYGRLKVINRISIPKGQFTYDLAVKKIIELDKIYDPVAIYPDKGAGRQNVSMT